MPAAVIDANGTLHISWFDTRNSGSSGQQVSQYDIYATYSKDAGTTFAPNARVTPMLMNSAGVNFIGDYAGITVEPSAGVAHPVWTKNGLNHGQLQTTTLTPQ